MSLEPGSGRGRQGGRAGPGSDRLARGPSGGGHRLRTEHDAVNSKEPIQQCSRPNRCCGCLWCSSIYPPAMAGGVSVDVVLVGGRPIGLLLSVLGRLVTTNGQEPRPPRNVAGRVNPTWARRYERKGHPLLRRWGRRAWARRTETRSILMANSTRPLASLHFGPEKLFGLRYPNNNRKARGRPHLILHVRQPSRETASRIAVRPV